MSYINLTIRNENNSFFPDKNLIPVRINLLFTTPEFKIG